MFCCIYILFSCIYPASCLETWGAGVETQENKKIFVLLSKKDKKTKNLQRDVGGWGRYRELSRVLCVHM